jgi:ribonuclease HI
MLHIFTDGSSRGNPGRGGWGAIVISSNKVVEMGGREEDTTNNRMEMRAIIEGLRFAYRLQSKVIIFTDSGYVIKGATQWVQGWKKSGWKTSQKQDVLNREMWEEMSEFLERVHVEFVQVKGHAGVPLNERADLIATSFADDAPIDLYNGERNMYPISTSYTRDSLMEQAQQKSNHGTEKKSGKAYSYVSYVEGILSKDKTWSECEARVKGKKNALFKKAFTKDDEDEIVKKFLQSS